MRTNLNLRKRILLGYLAPLLLMLGACVAVVWNTQGVLRLSKLVELNYAIVADAKDVHTASVQLQSSARGFVLFKNEASRKNFNQARSLFRDKLRALHQQVKDPQQLENLSKIQSTSERLAEFTQQLIQLADAGDAAKAVQLFSGGTGIELDDALDGLIDRLERRDAELLAARQLEQSQAIESLVTWVLASTAIAVLLAVVLGWWISVRISQSIVEAVAGMSTSSSEIASTVDEHERVVTQQAAAVNETTSTVEELGASSRQSASQAETVAEAAKQTLEVTQDGIQLANQASASMANMKQKVGSVAAQILRLSEQAGQIGSIAKVVGELAGETNMLALNAAVEAARAGEHGKGFAVVAAEVRKLADQSKKSAERANALVTEIQKATNSAVMVTEEGSRTAEDAAAIIGRTIDAFSSISVAANGVSVSAQQVLLNSKQQAAALGQVTEAMKSLAAGSAQMAAGTEQTKKGVQKLNSVALDLQAMV
ncbi:MAG: CHASE3 domain-containing protein [Burkholderiales bacterium]|nr:CHASE3 domain-containing protein [Burkholderiales bacterium]